MKRRDFLKKSGWYSISCAAAAAFPRDTARAISGTDRALRFVVFTDLHSSPDKAVSVALERAAASINSEGADLLIGGGDFITEGLKLTREETSQYWGEYFRFHRALSGEVFPAIGNHDLFGRGKDQRAQFVERFGLTKSYYSFDAAGYHFIVLDCVALQEDKINYVGLIDSEQLEWLKQDLSQLSHSTPLILVSHIPLVTNFFASNFKESDSPPMDQIVTNAASVLNLFEDRNLILVLQGHLHINEMIQRNNTTFITAGAVCGNWWNGSWHNTPQGYGVVTLEGKRLSWSYKDLS